MQIDYTVFRAIPAFADVPDDGLAKLAELGLVSEVPAKTILLVQGRTTDHVYVLLEGAVALLRDEGAQTEAVVEVLEAIDVFGIPSAITDTPAQVTARTLKKTKLFRLPAKDWRALLLDEPRLASVMLASLARQWRLLVRQVADLKLRSTSQRLACHLLTLAHQQNSSEIQLAHDKKLLAARLGASPEHLSRAFAALRDYGVRTRGSRVLLQDVPRLSGFAGPDPM